MRTDIPTSIQDTTTDLNPEGFVTLFEVILPVGAQFNLSPQAETTWQGRVYEHFPCTLADIQVDANGKLNRPKFSLVNPESLFSFDVISGALDNAIINRLRILKPDLDANLNFAIRESFRVFRILSLTNKVITLELRDVMDGPNFFLPARRYMPPEFPHVKI